MMPTRTQCIDMMYQVVKREVPISREAYENSLYGWDIDPVVIDDEHIGVVMMRGTEIHMHLLSDKALLHARRVIRNHVLRNLKLLGHLTTRTLNEPAVIRFLQRLGFYKVREEGRLSVFRLDDLKIQ